MLPLSVLEGNDESWRREGDSLGCTLVTLHAVTALGRGMDVFDGAAWGRTSGKWT